jgi:hypothetical protein
MVLRSVTVGHSGSGDCDLDGAESGKHGGDARAGSTKMVPVHEPVVTNWPARRPPWDCVPRFAIHTSRRTGSTAEFSPGPSKRTVPSIVSRTGWATGSTAEGSFEPGPTARAPWFC